MSAYINYFRQSSSFVTSERRPDFILVYKEKDKSEKEKRENYERSLKNTGLILDKKVPKIDDEHHQVYVYAKKDLLEEYAELLKLRMPINEKNINIENTNITNCDGPSIGKRLKRFFKRPFNFDKMKFPKQKGTLTAEFASSRSFLFDVKNENFFSESQRSMIVSYILELETYKDEEGEDINLEKLICKGVYSAAYPLHNDETRTPLLEEWAAGSKFYKTQPIDAIKDYFGVKIALYFAWLGFYTCMLIPVSIFGLICFIYGLWTLSSDSVTNDICKSNLNITMCPICDEGCPFWNLTEACVYSRMTHVFDNYVTLAFAVFMSVWSSIYLNLWKRDSAEMIHRWGLSDLRPENIYPRPEYLARLRELEKKGKFITKKKKCKVTDREELAVPNVIKLPMVVLSFTVALFWITMLLAAIFAILVFRISEMIAKSIFSSQLGKDDVYFHNILVPIVVAILDLIFILILNTIYENIALWLTKKEFLRTQSEFDDSLTLKIYVFQFINYYSAFFYIAFVKGRFIGRPGAYNRLGNHRLEECGPGGCLVELSIQLMVVMVGEQLWQNFTEYALPYCQRKWKEKNLKYKCTDDVEKNDSCYANLMPGNKQDIVNHDHQLAEWSERGLFDEYLEIVTQFGFVTLFVTAFPLGPMCALFTNIIEIRYDARKFLKNFRRPVAQVEKNIGIWLKIMNFIGKLAIISNGFIIAFTSNFIPRMVYMISRVDGGFLEYNLAIFDTRDFEKDKVPFGTNNVTVCRYPDYRNPPWHENPYAMSEKFWHILAARIIFVFVYQNVVIFFKLLIKWLIPETSKKLKTQILREQHKLYKIIGQYQRETMKKNKQKTSFLR